jgi:Tol biopolymer transport system component/chitodextrinase
MAPSDEAIARPIRRTRHADPRRGRRLAQLRTERNPMLIRRSDWTLQALVALALLFGAATAPRAFAGVDGTDCNCTATGAYLPPDPGVRPAVGTINAAHNAITSPGGRYRLERLGSNVHDPWRVVRVSNGAVLHPGIVANNFTWSPDDDRLATNYQDANALQYFSLWDLTDLGVNGRAAEIWTMGGTVWGSVRHRFSDDGSAYLFAGVRNVNQITLNVVDVPTRALHASTFPVGTLPSDIDTDLPENLGAPSNPGIAGWGWGPDATRFTYSRRTGTSPDEFAQTLVNVRTGVAATRFQNYPSAKWGFSPCGDVFGIVYKELFTQQGASALLYDTFAPSTIALTAAAAFQFDTVELGTNATSHFGLLGGVEIPIPLSNDADDVCPVSNQDPVAVFTPPATPYAGVAARFSDTSSDTDGTVVAWSWDFGDGGASPDRNPEHLYATAGIYTVRLTVTDDDGATDSTTRSVVVVVPPPIPPVASFAPPANARAGQPAAFVNLSTDADGTIVSQEWNFGDGESSTDANPVHVYADPGEYTASLTVTDDDGETDTASLSFLVCGTVGAASGKLLFGDSEFSLDPDLHVLNTPTQTFVQITDSSAATPSGGSAARWSPTGNAIVYTHGNRFTQQSIFVMNSDGTNRRQVTGVGTQAVTASAPRWTPDGQWIAFDNGTSATTPGSVGDPGIYAVRPDGTGLVRVADGTLEDVSPLLEPGCAAIAPAQRTPACYTLLRSFRYTEISTVRGDGSDSHVLFDTPGVISPRYSPNGAKIAFVFFLGDRHPSTFRDLYSIFVANVPSGPDPIDFDPQHPLLRGATYFFPGNGNFAGQVVWSPDGRELAFTDADFDLSLSDAGGCEVQRVAGQPGGDVMPFDWKPGTATQALGSVSGSVLVQDLGTNAFSPAIGTVVRINGGGVNTTTTTDANGRYSFANLPLGVSFFVSLDGLAGADISFGGRVVPELGGSAANANLFGVTGTVLLSGQVITPAGPGGGQPIAGVTVRVEGPTGPYQATTGADGRYSIAVRPLRTYTVTPELAGYRFGPASLDVAVEITPSALNDFEARERPPGIVAFTSSRDGNDEIYVSELDGAFETNLTNDPSHDVEPAVSPDGTRIAFASDRSGAYRIYTIKPDGSDVTGLETFPGSGVPLEGREPAWSLDGARLAIATSAGLRVVSFDGNAPIVATSDPTDTSPSWDRNGTRIYFERFIDDVNFGVQQVALLAVDLSEPSPPIETTLEYTFGAFRGDPAAKPDGPGLAHTYDDLDTSGGSIVARNDATATTYEFGGRDPAWSPDGQRIVGVLAGAQSFLFWSEPDGVRQRIFTSSGADREPSWGPGSLGPKCDNGVDDDGDGLVDLADPGCDDASDRSERGVEICDDEIDADGDGSAAFPQDRGCDDGNDPDETTPRFACDDGVDNDGDGFADLQDRGCPSPDATLENPACDNGLDDDGNGLFDFDDPKCSRAWPYWERTPGSCGFGAELVVVVGALSQWRRRIRRLHREARSVC